MDIKVVKRALKGYKTKKLAIETTLLRIERYKAAIDDPESFADLLPRPSCPADIGNKEKIIELLQGWVINDEYKIYPYQLELEQIDEALAALTTQERFIIECKYFKSMPWRDVEISLNDNPIQNNYITTSGIRKIDRQSIILLSQILKPYYDRQIII